MTSPKTVSPVVAVERSALFDLLGSLPAPPGPSALPSDISFAMGERQFLQKTTLMGAGTEFAAAASAALGVELPFEPNTTAAAGDVCALWLAPNEWLVVTPDDDGGKTRSDLLKSTAGLHALVVDVSDRWISLALKGSKVPSVLSKGTPLNLQLSAFASGQCASTLLAQAQVILHRRDDFPTFDLYVDSTFAESLWGWLETAAEEFGARHFSPAD